MKGSFRNGFFTGMFLAGIILSLIVLNGSAAGKQARINKPVKIKGKEEILVAKDIGIGSGAYPVFWCGSYAIAVYNEKIGLELIRIPTGERVKVSLKEHDYPFNCSAGGEWVVYMDRASIRLDKQDKVKPLVYDGKPFMFEPELDVWPVWEGYVADLYRHEVSTGKNERFAVVRSDLPPWEVISPDGLKVFLGNRHNSSMEMPEPKWEALWFTRDDWDWSQTGACWFKDSSGVVSRGHTPTNRLFVEFFGEGGWTERFVLGREFEDNISRPKVDEENKIYFLTQEKGFGPVSERGKWFLHRCIFKDKGLSCVTVLERNRYIISYEVLPDGDIIFSESGDNCIRLISPRHTDAECVITGRYVAEVEIIGISPDGRWLAYETLNKLFVIELASD